MRVPLSVECPGAGRPLDYSDQMLCSMLRPVGRDAARATMLPSVVGAKVDTVAVVAMGAPSGLDAQTVTIRPRCWLNETKFPANDFSTTSIWRLSGTEGTSHELMPGWLRERPASTVSRVSSISVQVWKRCRCRGGAGDPRTHYPADRWIGRMDRPLILSTDLVGQGAASGRWRGERTPTETGDGSCAGRGRWALFTAIRLPSDGDLTS